MNSLPLHHRFRRHYTREEARLLIPTITDWLGSLTQSRADLEKAILPMEGMLRDGCSVGGNLARRYLEAFLQIQSTLREFASREIFVKDLERGLIDFPAFVAGREVFLCWERGESDVVHWHDLDGGYTSRSPLDLR